MPFNAAKMHGSFGRFNRSDDDDESLHFFFLCVLRCECVYTILCVLQ